MLSLMKRLRLALALRWVDCQLDDLEFSQACLDTERDRLRNRRADIKSELVHMDARIVEIRNPDAPPF